MICPFIEDGGTLGRSNLMLLENGSVPCFTGKGMNGTSTFVYCV